VRKAVLALAVYLAAWLGLAMAVLALFVRAAP
jgi:hypothetical protein